jgi:hypothetical protein
MDNRQGRNTGKLPRNIQYAIASCNDALIASCNDTPGASPKDALIEPRYVKACKPVWARPRISA